jgi:5,10-methylenetetrahydromethanopterin reductase
MRIGTMLSMPGDNSGAGALVDRAAAAEAAGFASVWLPQVFTIDALMVLALAGRATRTIELGTAVVPTYPRHPIALATQALTVQDATRNRLALGIGLSHKFVIEDMFGLDFSKPIPHMKDYLTILNGLLAGERVQHKGAEYAVSAQIAVPGTKKPPVIVAALGPAMLKLCGRLADGTLTWMGGIDYLRDIAVPTMRASAAAAKRAPPRFVAMVPTLLTSNVAAGRDTVNTTFAMYGQVPSYRATLDRGGAANPADVGVIGNEAAIEAGLSAYAAVGVTEYVAVVPLNAPEAKATIEFVARLARSAAASS